MFPPPTSLSLSPSPHAPAPVSVCAAWGAAARPQCSQGAAPPMSDFAATDFPRPI
jgi:hypothetical protein